jgi:NAD(P)-dependent dehydrogenase (short-subunit alcohol dehydrogenase family)
MPPKKPSKTPRKPVKSSTPRGKKPYLPTPTPPRKRGPIVGWYLGQAAKIAAAAAAERAALEEAAAEKAAAEIADDRAAVLAERAKLERLQRELAESQAAVDAERSQLSEWRDIVAAQAGIEIKSAQEYCDDYLDYLKNLPGGPREFGEGGDGDKPAPRNPTEEDVQRVREIAALTGESESDVYSTLCGSPPDDFGVAA